MLKRLTESEAVETLARQIQWALENYLYARGLSATKPSAEPPESPHDAARKNDARLGATLKAMRSARRAKR